MPEELDLSALATAALNEIELLTRQLAYMSKRFGYPEPAPSPPGIILRGTANQSVLNVEFLKEIQSGDSEIIIERLYVLNEGSHMSEYNINQSGSNLTAIVDSYKSTQLIGGGFSTDVEAQIKALLDSIISSQLPEAEKKEAVEATTAVVGGVKKDGKLAGNGKVLWSGIRETIKSIPAALSAWDALKKHWG